MDDTGSRRTHNVHHSSTETSASERPTTASLAYLTAALCPTSPLPTVRVVLIPSACLGREGGGTDTFSGTAGGAVDICAVPLQEKVNARKTRLQEYDKA